MIVDSHDVIFATLEIVNEFMTATASDINYMLDSQAISYISRLPENIWLPDDVIILCIFINDINRACLTFGGKIALRRCKVQTNRW